MKSTRVDPLRNSRGVHLGLSGTGQTNCGIYGIFLENSPQFAPAMPRPSSKSFHNQSITDAQTEFRIGERIKMSPLGAARSPRLARKAGKVFGFTRYQSRVTVIFDGNKSSTAIHIDYIEPINRSRSVDR
jgi:hypothetical protein